MIFKYIFTIRKYLPGICFLLLIFITSCEIGSSYDSISDSGEGGSTSRFTIVNDYMYVVDNKNMKVFRIADPENPVKIKTMNMGISIETIFSHNNMLFIGSQFAMYIYDIQNPENPVKLSETSHFYSCDPVVADENYAYVTLRSNSQCGFGGNDELLIFDITDPTFTEIVNRQSMNEPYGLAVKGNRLYICTYNRIEVYDKSNVYDLELVYTVNKRANDIIVLDTVFLLVSNRGIYEYSYTENSAELISTVYETNE